MNAFEIQKLKEEWAADPCWDLEDTIGFEAAREELLIHRLAMEERWRQDAERVVREYARKLGTENLVLARYVMALEGRLARLESALHPE